MIGVAACGEVAKGERVVRGALDPAAGKGAGGIAIDQQAEQHLGVVSGAAASAIGPSECAKVEPFDGFKNEARQMLFWQPVIQRRREQVVSLAVDRAKAAHAVAIGCVVWGLSSNEARKSDRLLGINRFLANPRFVSPVRGYRRNEPFRTRTAN